MGCDSSFERITEPSGGYDGGQSFGESVPTRVGDVAGVRGRRARKVNKDWHSVELRTGALTRAI